MPITSSAKKALRQNVRRRALNVERKDKMHAAIKNFRKLAEAGNFEEAKKTLPAAYKTLDKMVKVGFIKRGKADRLKSRLSKKLSKLAKK